MTYQLCCIILVIMINPVYLECKKNHFIISINDSNGINFNLRRS